MTGFSGVAASSLAKGLATVTVNFRLLPLLAVCLTACASAKQQAPVATNVAGEVAPARIQMCPDLGLRELDCQAAERRKPECAINQANYKFLGIIESSSTGVTSTEREVFITFAERARRLKADAIIEVRREQRPGSNVWRLTGRAVTFLDPTCKSP